MPYAGTRDRLNLAERHRDHAEHLRNLAFDTKTDGARQALLTAAACYDQIAESVERLEKVKKALKLSH